MSQSNKIKKLTVREIREIEPKAEVFEIQPYHKIMVMLKKSIIPEANQLLQAKAKVIMETFAKHGIEPIILIGVDDDVKFYEIGDAVKR